MEDDDIEILASGIVKQKRSKTKSKVKPKPKPKEPKIPPINITVNVPKTERKKREKRPNILDLSKPILDKGYKSSKRYNRTFDYSKRNILDKSKPILLQDDKKNDKKYALDFFNNKLEEYIEKETKLNGKYIKLLNKKLFSELYNKALVDTNLNGYKISDIPLQSELYNKYDNKLIKENYEKVKENTEDIFYQTIDKFIVQKFNGYERLTDKDYNDLYDKTLIEIGLLDGVDTSFIPKKSELRNSLYKAYDERFTKDVLSNLDKLKRESDKKIDEISNYLDTYVSEYPDSNVPDYIIELLKYSRKYPKSISIISNKNPLLMIPVIDNYSVNQIFENVDNGNISPYSPLNLFAELFLRNSRNLIKEIEQTISEIEEREEINEDIYLYDKTHPNYNKPIPAVPEKKVNPELKKALEKYIEKQKKNPTQGFNFLDDGDYDK